MRYRPDTLSSYEDLFERAHALTKEARFERIRGMGRWIQRRLGGKTLRDAETKARAATEQAARSDEIAQTLRDKAIKQDLDAAVLKEKLETAQRDFAAQYGAQASPEAFENALKQKRLYKGLGLAGLGAGAATVGLGIPIALAAGRRQGEGDRKRTRNLAFGVGAASGLAAPHVIQGLGQIARGMGGSTGLFPGLQQISPTYASDMYGGRGGGGGYGGGY